ncbi:MAG TPA: DUF4087 domain-containing protein [Allosphingosinicella sp.]|nr:DUF4087 domain-containing protein [Allosphingosinicella sp.]
MIAALLALLSLAAAPAQSAPERRCGWLQNPTPANYWLVDRDGEWTIMAQGGYQAEGWDEMPDMSARGWVEVNGHYGYGCACMTVSVDRRTRRITRIHRATPVPLAQCRRDRRLPRN